MGLVGGTGPLLLFAAMADFPEPQTDEVFNWQEILIILYHNNETAPNMKYPTKIKSFFSCCRVYNYYKAEILCKYAHYLPVSSYVQKIIWLVVTLVMEVADKIAYVFHNLYWRASH